MNYVSTTGQGSLTHYRSNNNIDEQRRVAATGASETVWLVKIVGHVAYNVYRVQQVSIIIKGVEPIALGDTIWEVFNISEEFRSTGSLPLGTYALMWALGDKRVIAVKP